MSKTFWKKRWRYDECSSNVQIDKQYSWQRNSGLVPFTYDLWTSANGHVTCSLTGHQIIAPADKPIKWELKSFQLAFAPFEGNHSGANISKCLINTIDHYKLCKKVSSLLRVLLVYQIRTRLFPWARSFKNIQQFSESIDTVYWYRANTLLLMLHHMNKCGKSDNNMRISAHDLQLTRNCC